MPDLGGAAVVIVVVVVGGQRVHGARRVQQGDTVGGDDGTRDVTERGS
jgi:hypothetical protein